MGDLGSIPRLGKSPGEGKDYLLQYSGLENFMDCIGHGVTKSRTQQTINYFSQNVNGAEVEKPWSSGHY